VEGTAQQVDCGIVVWMESDPVNSMWKVLHSKWTVVLWVECSVLQWTVCGRYCTDGGQCYCGLNDCVTVNIMLKVLHSKWSGELQLNGVCYSEQYVEGTAQQVGNGVAAWMEFVTLNIMLKVLTTGGEGYCGLNGLCYSEHYVEFSAQQGESGVAAWMECVTMNIMCKVLTAGGEWYCGLNGVCYCEHYVEGTDSRWREILWVEWSVIQWTVCRRYWQQLESGFAAKMDCVTMNIKWKVLTGVGEWYYGLNGVCYCEQYVEGTDSSWRVELQFEWSVLHWTLYGRYWQQVESVVAAGMECVTVNIMWKVLHRKWTVFFWNEWSVFVWTLCGIICTEVDNVMVALM